MSYIRSPTNHIVDSSTQNQRQLRTAQQSVGILTSHRRGQRTVLRSKSACDAIPLALIMDTHRAFHATSRDILIRTLYYRFPSGLASILVALLTPISIKTQNYDQGNKMVTTFCVPRGGVTSPALFNIFINEFLRKTNTQPRFLSSCYTDDVLRLAEDTSRMQKTIMDCKVWAKENRMK